MPPAPAPRDFPMGPVVEHLRRTHARYDGGVAALMRLLGMNGPDARRAMTDGLTVWQADRAACRLGMHPSELWGDLWLAMTVVDDVVARDRARLERWVHAHVRRLQLAG